MGGAQVVGDQRPKLRSKVRATAMPYLVGCEEQDQSPTTSKKGKISFPSRALLVFTAPCNVPEHQPPPPPTTTQPPIMVLEAIKYTRGTLSILDQLKLPHATVYDPIVSSTDAWHAIKAMRTRGAPAIAIVAALSLAVELDGLATRSELSDAAIEVAAFVDEKLAYLVTSRPTAVNLADAARKLKSVVEAAAARDGATGVSVREAYVKAAEQMLVDDVKDNENIGAHGARWIKDKTQQGAKGKVSVVTHCNTGYVLAAS